MLKRILVGLGNLEYARSATAKAIEVAQVHDAQLTGLTLFDVNRLDHAGVAPIGAGHLAKELKDSRLDDVEGVIAAVEVHFASKCEKAGVAYKLRRESGDPLQTLVSLARYQDLVVCGLNSLFQHGVVDEPADELEMLVRQGVRPMLALPDEDRPIRKVMICYSGSLESAKTMRRFLQLQLWPDAALKIVVFGQKKANPETLLADAAEYCRCYGFDPETEHVIDAPQNAILDHADACGADLIVLGNSTKRLLLRKILGETAMYVMRNSELPLFLAQ